MCVTSRSLSESLSDAPSFRVSSLRRPHPPLPLCLHCSCSITLFTSAPLSRIFSTLSSPSSLSSPRLVSPLLRRLLFSPKKKIKRDCSVSEFSRLPRGQMTFPPRRRVGKAILRVIYHRSNDFLQTSRIAFPPAKSHPLSPIYNSPFILFHFQYFSHSAAL